MTARYRTLIRAVCSIALLTGAVSAAAGDRTAAPSGVVSMVITTVGLDVGVEWGSGLLTLTDGHHYRFSVKGIQVGSAGVAKSLAHGSVYHLTKVEDFSGSYVAVEAGTAFMDGEGVVAMQNRHGVVINLLAVEQGLMLALAVEGVSIEFKKSTAETSK